jgi:hypothetical protein
MAGKNIPFNGRENYVPPMTPFILDDKGYMIGLQHRNGVVSVLPASGWDDSLTAAAGGGQTNALPLNYRNSRVTTVGTAADSVVLPFGVPGMSMIVVNAAAANSMNVFPATGDAINALAADAAFAIAANKHVIFTCSALGRWHANVTA